MSESTNKFLENLNARVSRLEKTADRRSDRQRRRDERLDEAGASQKPQRTVIMMCATLGILGIPRMYLGKIWTGMTQMGLTVIGAILYLTFGNNVPYWTEPEIVGMVILASIVVWTVVDLVTIATGRFRDAQGRYVVSD